MLVGADGVNSKVRSELVAKVPDFSVTQRKVRYGNERCASTVRLIDDSCRRQPAHTVQPVFTCVWRNCTDSGSVVCAGLLDSQEKMSVHRQGFRNHAEVLYQTNWAGEFTGFCGVCMCVHGPGRAALNFY